MTPEQLDQFDYDFGATGLRGEAVGRLLVGFWLDAVPPPVGVIPEKGGDFLWWCFRDEPRVPVVECYVRHKMGGNTFSVSVNGRRVRREPELGLNAFDFTEGRAVASLVAAQCQRLAP